MRDRKWPRKQMVSPEEYNGLYLEYRGALTALKTAQAIIKTLDKDLKTKNQRLIKLEKNI